MRDSKCFCVITKPDLRDHEKKKPFYIYERKIFNKDTGETKDYTMPVFDNDT